MTTSVFPWPPEAICLHPDSPDAGAVAEPAYQRTCRTDFAAPGFCVIHLGRDLEPVGFRRFMVELKQAMAAIHESRTGKTLAFRSAQRFDQQQDTRPHLDGGPDECFLLLGYEPTEVEARLEVFDYARCAFDLGITPKAFMAEHNPMFDGGYERLRPYATPVPCFAGRDYRVLCINNSSAAYSDAQPAWQGVLHTATMVTPDADQHRVIDYTLVASVPAGTADAIEPASLDLFIAGPGDGSVLNRTLFQQCEEPSHTSTHFSLTQRHRRPYQHEWIATDQIIRLTIYTPSNIIGGTDALEASRHGRIRGLVSFA